MVSGPFFLAEAPAPRGYLVACTADSMQPERSEFPTFLARPVFSLFDLRVADAAGAAEQAGTAEQAGATRDAAGILGGSA